MWVIHRWYQKLIIRGMGRLPCGIKCLRPSLIDGKLIKTELGELYIICVLTSFYSTPLAISGIVSAALHHNLEINTAVEWAMTDIVLCFTYHKWQNRLGDITHDLFLPLWKWSDTLWFHPYFRGIGVYGLNEYWSFLSEIGKVDVEILMPYDSRIDRFPS